MATTPTPARQFRVGGSKFTAFFWQDQLIALANQISHTSPAPVAQAVAIQPLDSPHPREVITAAATGMGTLVLQIFEVYGKKVWDDLAIIGGSNDLVDVFNAVAGTPDEIQVKKFVYPPAGSKVAQYYDIYHNCVIADIRDDETIEVGTMQILKNLTINYTYSSRS